MGITIVEKNFADGVKSFTPYLNDVTEALSKGEYELSLDGFIKYMNACVFNGAKSPHQFVRAIYDATNLRDVNDHAVAWNVVIENLVDEKKTVSVKNLQLFLTKL